MDHTSDDQKQFELLNHYLERIQAGDSIDFDLIRQTHPQLASTLDCLDALDNIAPTLDDETQGVADSSSQSFQAQPSTGNFGDYELLGEIGRGGMGVVYKARQKDLDRTVAIKMILASHLASTEHVQRFQAEAKAAARLQHSNIVQIHEVGQCSGQHYFAMEYIEGTNLGDRLARDPFDVDTTVRLIEKVARAVAHLHKQGIIHRDLKPSNILLDTSDQPHITDFGLAKFFESDSKLTATGVITGTPSYMSPEQASGQSANVTPESDIYSLGAILYELLTGRPPFREENTLDTVMQVISRAPVLPRRLDSRIPRNLELICLKCLEKSPDDRYHSAEELANELARFSKGEPLETRPPSVTQQFHRWTRRQPALASRFGALGAFYLVEQFNYMTSQVDQAFHIRVSIAIGVWAVTSFVLQQFLESNRWSIHARFVWGTLDSILFLTVLLTADGVASPLTVGYFLLITASGLWFRVRFVWFMTILSLISYAVLILDFNFGRTYLQDTYTAIGTPQYIIFAVALIVQATATSYLVQRVKTLSDYCRQSPESKT